MHRNSLLLLSGLLLSGGETGPSSRHLAFISPSSGLQRAIRVLEPPTISCCHDDIVINESTAVAGHSFSHSNYCRPWLLHQKPFIHRISEIPRSGSHLSAAARFTHPGSHNSGLWVAFSCSFFIFLFIRRSGVWGTTFPRLSMIESVEPTRRRSPVTATTRQQDETSGAVRRIQLRASGSLLARVAHSIGQQVHR